MCLIVTFRCLDTSRKGEIFRFEKWCVKHYRRHLFCFFVKVILNRILLSSAAWRRVI